LVNTECPDIEGAWVPALCCHRWPQTSWKLR
jgi:hypothetical protein